MFALTAEIVPLLLAMVIMVPLTFEVIRTIMEDKMDFDIIINLYLLRFLEVLIAFMIFPTALVFVIVLLVYNIMVETMNIARSMVNYFKRPRILSRILDFFVCLGVFLGLLVCFIILLKYVYSAL